jgi:hypothetical protein
MTVRYSALSAMLLNQLQKQAGQNRQQAKQIQDRAESNKPLGAWRLSAQVTQLKGIIEQAIAAPKGSHSLAAAFNRPVSCHGKLNVFSQWRERSERLGRGSFSFRSLLD